MRSSKKKVKRKSVSKKQASKKTVIMNFKVSAKDFKLIARLSKLHAGGNHSAWLRYACVHFRPERGLVIR